MRKKEATTHIPSFVGADNITSLIPTDLMARLKTFSFASKKGTKAWGIEASIFPAIHLFLFNNTDHLEMIFNPSIILLDL